MGAFDIKYLPRTTIKGQVLVDLVAKFTECLEKITAEENEVSGAWVTTITIPYQPIWRLYVDGAANQKGSSIGIVLQRR